MRRAFTFILVLISVSVFAQKKSAAPLQGYDKIHPFKDGIARVEKDKKVGFIREDGSVFIDCLYDNIYPWEDGRARIEIAGKYGYIRQSDGEIIIDPRYTYIGPFRNGVAVVMISTGKKGLINDQGEVIVPVD